MTNPSPDSEESSGTTWVGGGHHAAAYMLTGVLMGVGLGWFLESVTGWHWVHLPCMLAGLALSWYTVWLRYVRPDAIEQSNEES